MTRVAAFITQDAIVVASDGRALNHELKVVNDNMRKIYIASDHTLLLPSGLITSDISTVMDEISNSLSELKLSNTTDIAKYLVYLFNESVASWLFNDQNLYVVAGYDDTGGKYVSKLYALKCQSGVWDLLTPLDGDFFIVAGDKYHDSYDYIKGNQPPALTDELNKYAVRLIDHATKIAPDSIGGQIGLWNIFPRGNNPMKRFLPNDIKRLRD